MNKTVGYLISKGNVCLLWLFLTVEGNHSQQKENVWSINDRSWRRQVHREKSNPSDQHM